MYATAIGWLLQNRISFSIFNSMYLLGLTIGSSGIAGIEMYDTGFWILVVQSIISFPILFTLFYAPFDLVSTLKEENEHLKSLSEDLTQNIERLKKVEHGMQRALTNMGNVLIEGGEKQEKLLTALEHVYNDIEKSTDDIEHSTSQFMKSALEMSDLVQTLDQTTDQLDKILNDQKRAAIDYKIREIARDIDDVADGPDGLRYRLKNNKITTEDKLIILDFLEKINDIFELNSVIHIGST